MKIVAWITLGLVIFVIAALFYYLVVGALLFHLVFAKRSFYCRAMQKGINKKIKDSKIDLCWWEKVKFKKVLIKNAEGFTLVGRFYDANAKKTAIVVHGFGQSYKEMQLYCKMFYEKNFNVLAVDNRTHGESQGTFIGFGWLDRFDLIDWCNYVTSQDSEQKIVLFGLSMGGTAVCCTTGEKLPDSVCAVISDCAFANADRQIDFYMKTHKIWLKLAKKHLYSFARRVHNFDLMKVDVTKQVKSSKVPILYIHGADDSFVEPKNMTQLFNATPSNLRDRFLVEGAEHGMAYPTAGVLYEKKISDFLKSRTSL